MKLGAIFRESEAYHRKIEKAGGLEIISKSRSTRRKRARYYIFIRDNKSRILFLIGYNKKMRINSFKEEISMKETK